MKKTFPSKESLFHFCCHLGRNGNLLRRGTLTKLSFLFMQTKKEPLQALNPFQLPKGSFPSQSFFFGFWVRRNFILLFYCIQELADTFGYIA